MLNIDLSRNLFLLHRTDEKGRRLSISHSDLAAKVFTLGTLSTITNTLVNITNGRTIVR